LCTLIPYKGSEDYLDYNFFKFAKRDQTRKIEKPERNNAQNHQTTVTILAINILPNFYCFKVNKQPATGVPVQ